MEWVAHVRLPGNNWESVRGVIDTNFSSGALILYHEKGIVAYNSEKWTTVTVNFES